MPPRPSGTQKTWLNRCRPCQLREASCTTGQIWGTNGPRRLLILKMYMYYVLMMYVYMIIHYMYIRIAKVHKHPLLGAWSCWPTHMCAQATPQSFFKKHGRNAQLLNPSLSLPRPTAFHGSCSMFVGSIPYTKPGDVQKPIQFSPWKRELCRGAFFWLYGGMATNKGQPWNMFETTRNRSSMRSAVIGYWLDA